MVDLSIGISSHLKTLRGPMTEFHGQTSSYGNIAAAGDRRANLRAITVHDAGRNLSLKFDQ